MASREARQRVINHAARLVRSGNPFLRRARSEETLTITLRLSEEGTGGCAHRYRTWGHDPGTVTCSCGARWRARIR